MEVSRSRRSVAVTQAEIHRALNAVIHPPLRLPDDGVASILGFVP